MKKKKEKKRERGKKKDASSRKVRKIAGNKKPIFKNNSSIVKLSQVWHKV